jgi:hypothetical protein
LIVFIPFIGQTQPFTHKINPNLINKIWQAQWILHPTASSTLPQGLIGNFVWQGKTLLLQPGVQKINL